MLEWSGYEQRTNYGLVSRGSKKDAMIILLFLRVTREGQIGVILIDMVIWLGVIDEKIELGSEDDLRRGESKNFCGIDVLF